METIDIFTENTQYPFIITVLLPLIIAAVLPFIIKYFILKAKNRKNSIKVFESNWIPSKKLKYTDISGRIEYPEKKPSTQALLPKKVKDALDKYENILLKSEAMAGKTYFTINYLRNLEDTFVLLPRYDRFDTFFEYIPKAPKKSKYKIIFIDDIHTYTNDPTRLNHFIEKAKEKGYIIWANTISGNDYRKVKEVIYIKLFSTFREIKIPSTLSISEALSIAKSLGINRLPDHFDGNIGSIFHDIIQIKKLYDSFDYTSRSILVAIKQLYLIGLYHPSSFILKENLTKLIESYKPKISSNEANNSLDCLKNASFIFESQNPELLGFEERFIRILVYPDLIVKNFIQDISKLFPNNVFSFNQAIRSESEYKGALYRYKQMQKNKVQPNHDTFAILIRKSKDTDIGLKWIEEMNRMKFNINNNLIINSILFTTQGEPTKKEKLISKFKSYGLDISENIKVAEKSNFKLNVYSYTNLMKISGDYSKAIEIFDEMKNNGINPDSVTFNVLIKLSNNLNIGLRLLEEMKDYPGIFPDSYTFGIIMNLCKNYEEGRGIFEKMTHYHPIIIPNEANYRILMGLSNNFKINKTILQEMIDKEVFMTASTYGYLINQAPNFIDAINIFNKMIEKEITPTNKEYGTLMSKAPDFVTCKIIFCIMIIDGITPTEIEYCTLIKFTSSFNEGKLIFDEMQKKIGSKGNVEIYGALISKIKNNDSLASQCFKEMLSKGIEVNTEIYGTLINVSSNFETGKKYFEEMNKKNLTPTIKVYGALMNISQDFTKAEEIFTQIPEYLTPNIEIYGTLINLSPNYVIAREYFKEYERNNKKHVYNIEIYNTLIKKSKNLEIGRSILKQMNRRNITPDNSTYGNLISISYDLTKGKEIFQEMIDEGITPNTQTCCTLIKLAKNYKHNKYEVGRNILEEIINKKIKRDEIIYGTLMSLTKEYKKRKELFNKMKDDNITPNSYIYSMMIESSNDVNIGNQYLLEMEIKKIIPNTWVYNSIIKIIDNYDDAIKILRYDMKKKGVLPDIITYSQLISKCKDFDISLKFLLEMAENKIEPNEIIYNKISQMAGNNEVKQEKLTEIRKILKT